MTVNDPTSETNVHSKQRLSSRLSPLCPYSSNDSMSTDMKLGQENTDISLTVDVINDLHISAQPGTSATEYIEVIY